MAFQHFGVLRELLRRDLLPTIISGTSGGAAVACYVCCRTDAELRGEAPIGRYPLRLDPDEIQPSVKLGSAMAQWAYNYWQEGCLLLREPMEEWAEQWAMGDTTFLEAYERTGRVLNITTCCLGEGGAGEQVPLLLNYQTHPHVLLSSAMICSGSMPNLLNPSKLYEKCPETGIIRAHCNSELCYADGSIDFDIPSIGLAQAFGVRYTIASQVNPHVIPFHHPPHGEAGRPTTRIIWSQGQWRGGFLLCALEVVLKEVFKAAWRIMGLLQLLPPAFGAKWDLFFAQVYEGSVTLCSERGYFWKVLHAMSNPSRETFRIWWHEGQLMLWPKMSLIEKRLLVERALFRLDSTLEASVTGGSADASPAGSLVCRRRSFARTD